MAFADYFFSHTFNLTGSAVTACYIDLSIHGRPPLQKVLTTTDNQSWRLTLTEAETNTLGNGIATGHLVAVTNSVAVPIAMVKLNIDNATTQRRPV
jgi:hypothetical protein